MGLLDSLFGPAPTTGLLSDPNAGLALAASLLSAKRGQGLAPLGEGFMGAMAAHRQTLTNQLAALQVQQQQLAIDREKARAAALRGAFGQAPQSAPQQGPQSLPPQQGPDISALPRMSTPENPQYNVPPPQGQVAPTSSAPPSDPRATMRAMYYRTAQQLAQQGFGDDAQKFFDMAIKLEDEYSPTPQTLMENGKPVTTLISKQGNVKQVGNYAPKPDYKEVNTGNRVGFVDPLTGQQGPSYAVNLSPADRAKLSIEGANLGINQQKLRLEQFNADPFGTFGINKQPIGAQAATAAPGPNAPPSSGAGLSGNDFLSTLPKPQADQVKALAEGRMAFPAGFALKSPYWQAMIQAVSQYDPSFDAINYNARAAVRKDFTSGNSSKSLNALNTVAGHLEELDNAITSLHNKNFTPYNYVANKVAGAFGDPAVTNYQTVLQTVAPELERAYRGAGGSEGSLQRWQTALSGNNGIEQQRAAVRELAKLLGSKMQALSDTYSKGLGATAQGLPILSPRAKAVFDKLGGGSTGGTLTANPDGSFNYQP